MKLHTMPGNTWGAIKNEIPRALELLGADRGLLGIVGSWRDTLPDSEILKALKQWNERKLATKKD